MPSKSFPAVAALLSGIMAVPEEDISPDTAFTKENGLTPIDIAKLVLACEKRFNIQIRDEDVHELLCPQDVALYVDRFLDEGSLNLALHNDTQRDAWYYE